MNPTAAPAVRAASRRRRHGPNHHLYSNNGTWWLQVTVHRGPIAERVRRSLQTGDVDLARQRRDRVLATMSMRPEPSQPV